MSEENKDPVKLHKEGNTLYELEKYQEAKENFLRASELYKKSNNFFDTATMIYKAGECVYILKDYEEALEYFKKSADLSFEKGFDRFGVSALEYIRDVHKALKNNKKAKEMEKKIKELKAKLAESF